LFISSEGAVKEGIAPFIAEFDLQGQLKESLLIPNRFLPDDSNQKGIQDNLGFESLTLGITSTLKDDPFRLFTATESALIQDSPTGKRAENLRVRLLHYVIDPIGAPVLVSEQLYVLDEPPSGAKILRFNGIISFRKRGLFSQFRANFWFRRFWSETISGS
jgi:hypothetical protein